MISFDGTHIAVNVSGPVGAPVVLLVHGLGLSVRSWGTVPDRLATRYRVVTYDLRGHGRSGRAAADDYTLLAHAKDLREVIQHELRNDEKALVVGHSLGGGVILAYTHEHPDHQIAGVVFAGSGGSTVTFPGFPAHRMPQRVQSLLRTAWLWLLRGAVLVGRALRPIASLSDRAVRRIAFTSKASRNVVEQVRDDFLETRPRALAGTTLASVSHSGAEYAPKLEVPALVIHGDHDPEVPQREIDRLLAALPHGRLLTVPGAAHMLPLTHGGVVEAQIDRWIGVAGLQPGAGTGRQLGPHCESGPPLSRTPSPNLRNSE